MRIFKRMSRQSESNRRPLPYEGIALPAELCRHIAHVESVSQFLMIVNVHAALILLAQYQNFVSMKVEMRVHILLLC